MKNYFVIIDPMLSTEITTTFKFGDLSMIVVTEIACHSSM